MVNLFIVFNFDHSYQKECLFLFLKKTPNHQVILHNAKKHVEGSLFVANLMQLR